MSRLGWLAGLPLAFAIELAITLGGASQARAATPALPQSGGVFTVTGYLDDNTTANGFLSVREAVLLANGGTGANGLGRALTSGEQNDVGGACAVNGSGFITGGCGDGIADRIVFDIPANTVITLSASLLISDSAPTTLDGAGVDPTLDASGLSLAATAALKIYSDNNVVRHIGVQNAPQDGIRIDLGNSNTLFDVWVWSAGLNGINIGSTTSDSNTINQAHIGVGPGATSCAGGKGNLADGVVIEAQSIGNSIMNSVIGCNGGYGVSVLATKIRLFANEVGPSNDIGTNAGGAPLGNSLGGVALGGLGDTVYSNTIKSNSHDGIKVTGNGYQIGGNTITGNGCDGVEIIGASFVEVGADTATSSGPIQSGNLIDANGCWGVEVSGAGSAGDVIANNTIGTSGSGNTLGGVHLTGSSHANIVGTPLLHVILPFNGWPNDIRGNGGPGVLVDGDAHDNTIGTDMDTPGNTIKNNGGAGVSLSGSQVATNTVNRADIGGNTLDGIALSAGAHANLLLRDDVHDNQRNGIQLSGSGTSDNVISRTQVYRNTLDGINERNSAQGNVWYQAETWANGGLGIDRFGGNDAHNDPDGPLPIITGAHVSGGNIQISGEAAAYLLATNVVEIYAVATDPSGYGEGLNYLSTATVDSGGHWQLAIPGTAAGCYTAFETTTSLLTFVEPPAQSSEFGPNNCRVLLPLIER